MVAKVVGVVARCVLPFSSPVVLGLSMSDV